VAEHGTEGGFGTGLRAKLQSGETPAEPRSPAEAIAAAPPVIEETRTGAESETEAEALRAELNASLAREQQLRSSLSDQLDTSGRDAQLEQQLAEQSAALDLLSVSVEAGLGFDGAVQKLTEHMDGPLIEEFELALGGIRIGEGRSEALKKMSERSSSLEMASFVRAIIQADQLGISLGRILKVQAGDTRLKRQLLAEEKAMKAPIKMLFPTVIFIFPAMFLVVLGPAFLNLSALFKF